MSVVAGLANGGKIWMAGDSLVNDDGDVFEAKDAPKVFAWNEFVFGVCGEARVGDLIFVVFDPPDPPDDRISDYHYMVSEFIPELRRILKEGGVDIDGERKSDEDLEFDMLVGFGGNLYSIGADFSVCTFTTPYYAIGSGGSFALASLAATSAIGQIKDPGKRVEKACAAAIKRRGDCGGKIIVESI